jgi:hypothetical protein
MSGGAIIMMIIAIVVVWGSLAVSIVLLRRHPDETPEQRNEPG